MKKLERDDKATKKVEIMALSQQSRIRMEERGVGSVTCALASV